MKGGERHRDKDKEIEKKKREIYKRASDREIID
jgi:hypothetical protein